MNKRLLPELILIIGIILSVVIGIVATKSSADTPMLFGILIALTVAIFTLQLSIFSEQKIRLVFDFFFYRNNLVYNAISKLVDAYKTISLKSKEWSILHNYFEAYIFRIGHFSETAINGRLEKLPEAERQIYLRNILEGAEKDQTFRATSYVSINSWWRSQAGEYYYQANVNAAKRGVRIKRIFIVRSSLKNDIKRDVIKHSNDNIDVRVCLLENLPAQYLHNYAVLEDKVLTHSTISPADKTADGLISYAKGDIEEYKAQFELIWQNYASKPDSLWKDIYFNHISSKYEIQHIAETRSDISVLSHNVRNLLYDRPNLYDIVYKSRPAEIKSICDKAFEKYLIEEPSSILDLGCGTGSCLNTFTGNDSIYLCGVDGHSGLIDYAQKKYPKIDFECKDIRNLNLRKDFECVLMVGWVLNYAILNRDIELYISSVVSHIKMGGLFILEVLNGFYFLPWESRKNSEEVFEVKDSGNPDWRACAKVEYNLNKLNQTVSRTRTWKIYDRGNEENKTDECPFRLLFPLEISYILEKHGFKVLDINDNYSLEPGRSRGESLIIIARYETHALYPI